MSQPSIDAVVVNHNGERDLAELLHDERFRRSFQRVIVVDNASVDGSVQVVRESGVDLIEAGGNFGFSAGANVGLRASNADFVAVMNADIRVDEPEAIPALLRHFSDPDVGLVAPELRLPDGSIQDSARTVPSPATLVLRRWMMKRRGSVAPREPTPVDWVVGAFVVLRRSTALRVGAFDERFFLYFEDVELCVRLRAHGQLVIFDPCVKLLHRHVGASRGTVATPAVRQHFRSAITFYRSHPSYIVPSAMRRTRPDRPRVAALAWGAQTDRVQELARAVQGDMRSYGGAGLRGRTSAPLRWLVNGARTAAYLLSTRPQSVIVQNPPVFLSLLALAYCSRTGARLVLDSHPASFGRKNAIRWRLLLPLHRWVAQRSEAVLVTEHRLREEVERWGGTALLLHEAPATLDPKASPGSTVIGTEDGRMSVLLIALFAPDEPVNEVVDAVRNVDDIHLYITGDLRRAPKGLIERASANVTFTGFLSGADYQRALHDCDVVMALTTESTSIMRAAYEGVYAGKPLIVSDWPSLREMFRFAVHTRNEADCISAALKECRQAIDHLRDLAAGAREEQTLRWERQLSELERRLPPRTPDLAEAGTIG